MLEFMGDGMRVGEVLKLNVGDVDDQKLTIRNPKSGKSSEAVFILKSWPTG
jgi:integrase/recombinase XerD